MPAPPVSAVRDEWSARSRLAEFAAGTSPVVVIAVAIFVISRVFNVDDDRISPLLIDTLVCLGAALSQYRPIVGSTLVGAALALWIAFPAPDLAVFAALLPVYVAGAQGRSRLRLINALWYLPASVYPTVTFPGTSPRDGVQVVLLWLLLFSLAWGLGTYANRQRRQIRNLRREREEAVQAERMAIARDLHDAVASANARIVMRAEEARLRGISDPSAANDIDYILRTGRQSSRDLRGMLAALRTTVADGVGWHIESLAETIDQCEAELRRHGFEVQRYGSVDDERLAPTIRDTLGKVVVETTSNVIKHASTDGPCRILTEEDDEAIEIVVTSRRPPPPWQDSAQGLGLIGIQERILAIGGELEVVPTDTEWLVNVRIPY